MSQEKLQIMVMQKFWGVPVIEVYYGIVQVVNTGFCFHGRLYICSMFKPSERVVTTLCLGLMSTTARVTFR